MDLDTEYRYHKALKEVEQLKRELREERERNYALKKELEDLKKKQ